MAEIKANLENIALIFGKNDRFYKVPDYQRPYVWGKEECDALVDDLFWAFNDESEDSKKGTQKYFLGSIVLVERTNNDDRYELIDGQQRTTSFIILMCVFREMIKNLENIEKLGEAKKRVERSIFHELNGENEKLRFEADDWVQSDFYMQVLRNLDLDKSLKDMKKNGEKISCYLENAHYIKEAIDEKMKEHKMNEKELVDFILWFFENAELSVIICPNEDRAIQIFNVLNNRGVPLSPADILKSTLMHRIQNNANDRKAFADKWRKIVDSLYSNKLDFDNFFGIYRYYVAPKAGDSKRYDKEILEALKDKPSLEIIKNLEWFSQKFIELMNMEDKYIYLLRYLGHDPYWKSILMSALVEKPEHFDSIKRLILAWYYKHWIAGGSTTSIKQSTMNIIKAIKSEIVSTKEIPVQVADIIKENFKKYNTNEAYTQNLKSQYVYDKKWAKPVLLLVEYFSTDSKKHNFLEIRDTQAEHILPQNPDEEKNEWEQFSAEQKERWRDALANLTLISKTKNIKASNKGFLGKKEIYEKSDGVESGYALTRAILKYEKWDEESLKRRQGELIDKIDSVLVV